MRCLSEKPVLELVGGCERWSHLTRQTVTKGAPRAAPTKLYVTWGPLGKYCMGSLAPLLDFASPQPAPSLLAPGEARPADSILARLTAPTVHAGNSAGGANQARGCFLG